MKFGSVLGVDLYLRPYILVVFLISWLFGSVEAVLLAYAALAVHEAGHVAAARLAHMRVGRIEIAPYGGIAHIDGAFELLPSREMKIAAGGPAASFLLCLLTLGFSRIFILDENMVSELVKTSFIIGAFNLLPALPLDGGRILRALITMSRGTRAATRFSAGCGVFLGGAIAICSLALIFYGRPAFMPLLAGASIAVSASKAFRGADGLMLRSLVGGAHIDGIPTPVRRMAVSESALASHVLSGLRSGEYYELLVLDGGGRLLSVLNPESLRDAIRKGADTMKSAARIVGRG